MNHQSHAGGRLLFTVVFALMLMTACNPFDTDTVTSSNETAIAATIQAINATSTSTPISAPSVVEVESYSRIIEFSGLKWKVKSSSERMGPGPNHFSNSVDNVWVDENGQLHLKMTHTEGKWYCAEVVTVEPLGYGSYQFKLSSRVEQLDKQAVLGLFTWDTAAPQYNYREIDIELSRWGEDTGLNAQFVVQPWDRADNRHRFAIDPQLNFSTYNFVWTPESIQFLSFVGEAQSPDPKNIVEQWSYTGANIPPAGPGNARINLWLLGGLPPSDKQDIEMILSSFEYIPQVTTK